jgi:hypothetical protein
VRVKYSNCLRLVFLTNNKVEAGIRYVSPLKLTLSYNDLTDGKDLGR